MLRASLLFICIYKTVGTWWSIWVELKFATDVFLIKIEATFVFVLFTCMYNATIFCTNQSNNKQICDWNQQPLNGGAPLSKSY